MISLCLRVSDVKVSLELTRVLAEYKIKSVDFLEMFKKEGSAYFEGSFFYLDLIIGAIEKNNRKFSIVFKKPVLKFLVDSMISLNKKFGLLEIYDIYLIYSSFTSINLNNYFNTLNSMLNSIVLSEN